MSGALGHIPARTIADGVLYTLAGGTKYVEIPLGDESVSGLFISWPDGTSSATLTLESTLHNSTDAALTSADASLWAPETGITITGPAATAKASEMVHLGNNGATRMRLKIVPAADTTLTVLARRKRT